MVRNNFFGLGGAPQKQQTKENTPVTTSTPGHGGRRLSEEDGANFQSGSLGGRRPSPLDANQEDITKSERVAAEQTNQEIWRRDEVCLVKAWDSPGSTEQAKMPNEETVVDDHQSPDLSSTDDITLSIYDDEVWESPGAVVWNLKFDSHLLIFSASHSSCHLKMDKKPLYIFREDVLSFKINKCTALILSKYLILYC